MCMVTQHVTTCEFERNYFESFVKQIRDKSDCIYDAHNISLDTLNH